jgi:hypothetical protein
VSLSIGIRQRMNEHPRVTAAVIGVIVIASVGAVVMQVRAGRHTIAAHLPDSYFSVDDGKTFFVASGDNVAPFDYQGQQAVHALVYECNGKRFVGYLERYTPDARKLMIEKKSTPATEIYGRELKRPGDKSWVKSGDQKNCAKIVDVQCPDGSSAAVEPVEPS